MANDRWLSVDDVADYLGVKRFTVYRWIDKRGLPAHKSGKLWLLRKDEVDHWVRSGGRVVEDAQSSPPVCQGAADAGDAKLMLAAIPRAPHPLVAIHRELADVQLPEKAESEQRGRFKLAISPATQIAIIPDVARAQVGVVMGLASGVDMPVRIEALPIAGEGKVLPVGSVGRVMPESTAAAVAYVMSHAGDLGIQAATLALTDVAIVAEIGDIPAQSDSLGAAVAMVLASALTGTALRRWTAIAGRIAPDGCLLPVDDIPQRLRAAVRGGIREVFIPAGNAGQAESLPFLGDWPVKVIPTAHVNKILQLASAPGQLDMFRMAGNGGPKG